MAALVTFSLREYFVISCAGMRPGGQCQAGDIGSCMWFNNYTFISGANNFLKKDVQHIFNNKYYLGEPTLPDYMRTFNDIEYGGGQYDFTKVISFPSLK